MLAWALCAVVAASGWKTLAPGVEYAELVFDPKSEVSGLVRVVRVDPEKAELQLAMRSREGGEPRTAAEWADERGLVAVTNAGMFEPDQRSHTGRLVDAAHVNQEPLNRYQSALVFGPKKPGLPKAQVLDLDAPGAKELAAQYASMSQNLRLIKSPGVNVWKKNGRAWSEAAVAQDKKGRLLFLFTREPYQMAVFNDLLLALPLEVVRAFHVEGGPEASLSVHSKEVKLDLCGSYETGFIESDENHQQWPIPNVLGVRSR